MPDRRPCHRPATAGGDGAVTALLAYDACRSARGVSPAALSEVPVAAPCPLRTPRSATTARGALATEVCERGGGSPSPHRALVLVLLEFFRFELKKHTRARLSGGCPARCSGCTCPRVPPFGRGPPQGDGGLVIVVPRGLRQQCLYPEPGYLQFSNSSATTACASDTVADLKPWAVARR